MNKKICIIDYGSGNVRSVHNIFKETGVDVKVSNDVKDIDEATHIVLPGVGAFGAAMEKIQAMDCFDELKRNVFERRKPFLGICVGMQVLADEGHEHGVHRGLGWIPGVVRKLEVGDLYLPHVGWNNFQSCAPSAILEGIMPGMDFYYVHSYHFDAKDPKDVLARCQYGVEFAAMVGRDNIFGVQFHPEKSQKTGMKLLENFLSIA